MTVVFPLISRLDEVTTKLEERMISRALMRVRLERLTRMIATKGNGRLGRCERSSRLKRRYECQLLRD